MSRISPEEYANAVETGIDLAHQRCSSGRVMAQVLLSAYKGDLFQLDIEGLTNLDEGNYKIALKIIRGRYEVRREPPDMIADGKIIFQALWSQWERLEIVERAKQPCPSCDGRGKINLHPDINGNMRAERCSQCSGSRRICRCGRKTL